MSYIFLLAVSGYDLNVTLLSLPVLRQEELAQITCVVQGLPVPLESDIHIDISPTVEVINRTVYTFRKNDTILATYYIVPKYWNHLVTCSARNKLGNSSASMLASVKRMYNYLILL